MIAPRIEIFNETKLVGKKMRISFAQNKTVELWRSFSPKKKDIKQSCCGGSLEPSITVISVWYDPVK